MLGLALALVLPAAIVAPHVIPLHRVTPVWAAAVWLAVLALRALVAAGVAIFVFVDLPQTGVFRALAGWCLHEVIPLLAVHLGVSGHPLAHAAAIVPGLVLAASLLSLLVGLARGWVAVRHSLARALGEGPFGSTVVQHQEVLVAVTAFGPTRVVVSEAALRAMDDEELEASLAHELGHIHRRHRPLLLLASVFGALGRALPGTRAAERELVFHLERDADEYAVAATSDPLALASAICKAATGAPAELTALGGRGRASVRIGYLVDGEPSRGGVLLERATRALAAMLLVMALALAVSLPAWALAVPSSAHDAGIAEHCHR
jgi:Zn-dependent protease with chaperone function